jgi:hypothetical protein
MNIVKKIKSKLLTKLFVEWVSETEDIETLEFSKDMIQSRCIAVGGHRPIIGFAIKPPTEC